MDFEPLDAELEEALRPIVDGARDSGWVAVDSRTPEYRALKATGMFQRTREYYDGEARVEPTYAAMKYFERKARYEKERREEVVLRAADKLADVGATVAGTAVSKLMGM